MQGILQGIVQGIVLARAGNFALASHGAGGREGGAVANLKRAAALYHNGDTIYYQIDAGCLARADVA